MKKNISIDKYNNLVENISQTLQSTKAKAAQTINTMLVQSYWQIGKYIVEFEQDGKNRAVYGEKLLERLAKDLTLNVGKGFSRSNLIYMRKFFIAFPNSETVSHKLSWSHYFEILKSDDELEVGFYIKQCERENWSVRELKRQMKSMLFYRLALSKEKNEVIELSKTGLDVQEAKDILKDPYILEFLDLPQTDKYLESDLEKRLIVNLQKFLLELGKGFAFVARQYKINIGGRHFYIDLVFYHRILKCFVLIDLKRGEIEHNDIGQMNMYLNYFKSEENMEDDNEPIGIVLGAYKDHILMEYALEGISNQLFVSKYQLYLPDRVKLQNELNKLMDDENE